MKAIQSAFKDSVNYGILFATIGGNGATALVSRLQKRRGPKEKKSEVPKPAIVVPPPVVAVSPPAVPAVPDLDFIQTDVPHIGRLESPGLPPEVNFDTNTEQNKLTESLVMTKSLLMSLEQVITKQFSESKYSSFINVFMNGLEVTYHGIYTPVEIFSLILHDLSANSFVKNQNLVLIVDGVSELECRMFQINNSIPISGETKFYLLTYKEDESIWRLHPDKVLSILDLTTLFGNPECRSKIITKLYNIPSVWNTKLVINQIPLTQRTQYLFWTIPELSMIPIKLCKSFRKLYEGNGEDKSTLNSAGKELKKTLTDILTQKLPKKGLSANEKCWSQLLSLLQTIQA